MNFYRLYRKLEVALFFDVGESFVVIDN